MRRTLSVIVSIVLLAGSETPSVFAKDQDEVKKLTDRLLAVPTIRTESGFKASVLVRPGHLYDPVWLMSHNGSVWTNDDGGEEGDKGSQIVAIGKNGALSVVVGLGRLLPATGIGIAPAGFGA